MTVLFDPEQIDAFFFQHTTDVLRTESDKFFQPRHSECRILHAVLGLQDEIGELAKVLKAAFFYGKPLDLVNVKEELGDLTWYLFLAMDAAGLCPQDVLKTNICKLRARFPDKFTQDAALNRDLEKERRVLEQE